MEIRRAIHAGSWYPRFKPDLKRNMEDLFLNKNFGPGKLPKCENTSRKIIGGVSPHAGYLYSGSCAAFTYLNLFKESIPDTIIVLGTDHQGYRKIATMKEGEWETPLGNMEVDSELAEQILKNSNTIINDNSAFIGFPNENEHNIEIQMPFIKFCAGEKDIKILPIKIGVTRDFKTMDMISSDLATAIKALDKDIVIVASSDMSHKEVNSKNDMVKFREYDQEVINFFEKLDVENTLKSSLKTTICGPQTITTLLLTCKKLNAVSAKKLKYYTSHEIVGNNSGYCVGYFSGIIMK
ncbi:MAG: AmmeMemoRadiSam system protein B [Promethearchaeota archaeon]